MTSEEILMITDAAEVKRDIAQEVFQRCSTPDELVSVCVEVLKVNNAACCDTAREFNVAMNDVYDVLEELKVTFERTPANRWIVNTDELYSSDECDDATFLAHVYYNSRYGIFEAFNDVCLERDYDVAELLKEVMEGEHNDL